MPYPKETEELISALENARFEERSIKEIEKLLDNLNFRIDMLDVNRTVEKILERGRARGERL